MAGWFRNPSTAVLCSPREGGGLETQDVLPPRTPPPRNVGCGRSDPGVPYLGPSPFPARRRAGAKGKGVRWGSRSLRVVQGVLTLVWAPRPGLDPPDPTSTGRQRGRGSRRGETHPPHSPPPRTDQVLGWFPGLPSSWSRQPSFGFPQVSIVPNPGHPITTLLRSSRPR